MKQTHICKKHLYLGVILIFILALGIRMYKIQDKGGFFVDEYYTVLLSNNSEYGISEPLVEEGEYSTGKEIKERMFRADNSLDGIWTDIKRLRNTPRDLAHPSLYYSLFKVSLIGADSSDMDSVTCRGFLLNVFLFALGFFFLFRLAKLLFPDNIYLIFCVLGVAYLCAVAVGNTMYLRSYQLQETLLVMFTYVFSKLYLSVLKKENILSLKNVLKGGTVSAFFLMSGYFSVAYFLLLGGVLFLTILIVNRTAKNIVFVFSLLLVSCLFTYLIFPSYTDNFFEERGSEAMGSLRGVDFFVNMKVSMIGLARQVKANYAGIPIALLMGLSLVGLMFFRKKEIKKSKEDHLPLLLVLCAGIWLVATYYVAPFKIMRYGAPAFPIISLLFPFMCSFFKKEQGAILSIVFVLSFFVKTLFTPELYWERRIPDEIYENNTHIPLIVGGVPHYWMQMALTPYYTNDREIFITENAKEFKTEICRYDSVYVFIYKENYNLAIFKDQMSEHEEVSDILHGDIGWYYHGYLLRKKENSK